MQVTHLGAFWKLLWEGRMSYLGANVGIRNGFICSCPYPLFLWDPAAASMLWAQLLHPYICLGTSPPANATAPAVCCPGLCEESG